MDKKEVEINYNIIETQFKFLQGKVLTVIDATFSDKEQKKAVKDLINKSFSEQLNWVAQICEIKSSGAATITGRVEKE